MVILGQFFAVNFAHWCSNMTDKALILVVVVTVKSIDFFRSVCSCSECLSHK